MDSQRERIQADLRGLLQGEVYCDDVHIQLYASDASLYEILPLGVVRPRHVDDVVACVRYAAEWGLPIHARGAGTGLAGESLGPGLVIDFAHSMRRVIAIDGDRVTVQPGVVHGQLNRELAERGLLFGPDPAMSSVTTMGSVLALDGSGSHWLRYGSARGRVESMQVVLADGTLMDVRPQPIPAAPRPDPFRPGESDATDPARTRANSLLRRLADVIRQAEPVIAAHQPRSLVNRSGYHLPGVVHGDQIDLSKLLVGSEGTLALITQATVRADPLPTAQGVVLLFFDRLDSAARAALEAARLGVSACDIMDRRLLGIARETEPRYERLIPADAEAMLLVEQLGDDPRTVRDDLRQVIDRVQRVQRLAFDSRVAADREEVEAFWRLANQVVSRLYSLRGWQRPLAFVEDLAVPPERLPEFIGRLQRVLQTRHVTASLFGHAGHGQLHVRPFVDLRNPDEVRRMQDIAADLYAEVLDVGGTISGEHGDGLSRTWYVAKQYGPLYEVFKSVKQLFDPQNLLNPGKVVTELPQPLCANLRPIGDAARTRSYGQRADAARPDEPAGAGPDERPGPLVQLELNWEPEELQQMAFNCNGCGHCRTQLNDGRMCPIFRFNPREEATPRAKANLVRAVLSGRADGATLSSDALKAVTELCVNCHQCRLECPASIDIPKLVLETKAQYVATRGLPSSDWFFTRLDAISAWASWIRPIANWALGSRQMRWLLEKAFGLSRSRKLPRLAPRNFLRVAHKRRWTRPVRDGATKVLYFVDTYANWYDVQLAEAVVRVLEHNGVSVYVHPGQLPSGMAAITAGDVERVRRQARENVALLAEAARQGYAIVASEPSTALCLTREYPNLLDDDDVRLVARNSSEICSYLWRMHQSGQLELDLRPLVTTVGYHVPCHVRALGGAGDGEGLLRLIPGLVVVPLDAGCSGMAGTFGMKQQNFRASWRAGRRLIQSVRAPRLNAGVSECSACKLQMEQGTSKPTLHPVKLLALAYGLMPELSECLNKRSEELIVT